MERKSNRRKFLTTVGAAATVTLAGCSVLGGEDNPDNNGTGTPTTPGTNSKTKTVGGGKKDKKNKRGNVVEDFEKDVGKWQLTHGKMVTKKNAYNGSQSIVLTPAKKNKRQKNHPYARIHRNFGGDNSETLDLRKHDLSIAVKVNKPEPNDGAGRIKITTKLFAPTSSVALESSRAIPAELNGKWVQFDIGYTDANNDPSLEEILAMQIIIDSQGFQNYTGKEFEVEIDEIRKIPKPEKGKVMFIFDDGVISSHSSAFPILKEKGFPGSVAVIPGAIGGTDRMGRTELMELNDAGWDIMSHPQDGQALPKYSKEKQEQLITQAKRELEALGFKSGARHMVAPYNRINGDTLDLIKKHHDTNFLFGGSTNNATNPINPHFISRVQGTAPRQTMELIDYADRFNQLAVITYHRIGDGANKVPENSFQEMVDHVASKDMDVITPSQLIDGN